MDKIKILFIVEAVTLAHVARSVVLAKSLDPDCYDVHFAHCPRYRSLLGELNLTEHPIESISPEQFMLALAEGKPLYNLSTLTGYVEEDMRLISEIQPNIVVGDFRLSLAVSSELLGIPYVNITNACWSPYAKQRYIVPELPLTRLLGSTLAQWLFSMGRPIGFALHCVPMHRLRRKFGLKSLGFNLGEVYTHADIVLYADLPGLYQVPGLPVNHHFIGPVIWSPVLPLPSWWQDIPTTMPIVYVTLGSSGQAGLLPELIDALGQLELIALVSTAGASVPAFIPDNVFVERYLPGEEAVSKAHLVVCNGGSPTTQQALIQGVPVLGLPGNLDQYLNMSMISNTGGGRLMRSDAATSGNLAINIAQMLADSAYTEAAETLRLRFEDCGARKNFCRIINEISLSTD